jgi:hypothetical protein
MICDCGGGSSDLICHKIVSLEPQLKLDEAAPGTGMCAYSSMFYSGLTHFVQVDTAEVLLSTELSTRI